MKKNIFSVLFITALLLLCWNHESFSKGRILMNGNDDTTFQKDNKFSTNEILFNRIQKDTTDVQNNFSYYPKGFKKEEDVATIKFNINFEIDYFVFDRIIPGSLLSNNSFLHSVLNRYYQKIYGYDTISDPFILSFSKKLFTISQRNIKNYDNCYVAIISTEWDNANQNECMLLFNDKKKELSIWSYDKFKFDKEGNILALFRLKENRALWYYSYNTSTKNFISVAVSSHKVM